MRRVLGFSLVLLLAVLVFGLSSALAWDVADKVWVKDSMPPMYWEKSGGLTQKSGCSLQRYDLYRAGGKSQNTFRWAVICPKAEKFCVEVLGDNQQPGALPRDCVRAVPETAVNIAVQSFLYMSATKKK